MTTNLSSNVYEASDVVNLCTNPRPSADSQYPFESFGGIGASAEYSQASQSVVPGLPQAGCPLVEYNATSGTSSYTAMAIPTFGEDLPMWGADRTHIRAGHLAYSSRAGTEFRLEVLWKSILGSTVSSESSPAVAVNGTGWTWISHTFVKPNDPNIWDAQVRFGKASGGADAQSGDTWRFTGFYLELNGQEAAPTADEYFDGSSPSPYTYTYDWTGTPNDSTSTEVGPDGLRENLVPNPSFEVDTTGLFPGQPEDFSAIEQSSFANGILSGSACASFTVASPPIDPTVYIGQVLGAIPDEGQWVAARIPARISGSTGYFRASIQFRDASNAIIGGAAFGPYTGVSSSSYVYAEVAAQTPAGTAEVRVYVYMYDDTSGTRLGDGKSGHTDAWIASTGATLAEALANVAEYFDGDTFKEGYSRFYYWKGAARSSESTYTLINLIEAAPSLVLNYEHEAVTNNVVHRPLSGAAPVVVVRDSNLPSGTFEFWCSDEAEAQAVFDACNGDNRVEMVSDTVPGAPFEFVSTGNVRMVWNTPYQSWTVTVPYVRTT